MKKIRILLWLVAVFGMTSIVSAQSVEEEIAGRIKKIGSVCVEGEDCASGAAKAGAPMATSGSGGATAGGVQTVASAQSGEVEATYNKTCATCHNAGVAGAPKFGSSEDWSARVEKGKDVLYQSAINGLPPAMPAKGMCFNCSDEELKALVDYMLEEAR